MLSGDIYSLVTRARLDVFYVNVELFSSIHFLSFLFFPSFSPFLLQLLHGQLKSITPKLNIVPA